MSGTLFIVSTPIGNLQDLTPRAASTLAGVDFIAAEDTRVTLKLLNHLGLKKPLISYNQHNAQSRGQVILQRIEAGESAALCSDAGTPAISDPGEFLVRDALTLGLTVTPIPAASAAITALSVSGLATGRFVFEGFITQNKRQRTERIAVLAKEERTLILYEAPHKLCVTLQQLAAAFGANRKLTLCREITKMHEEIWPTTLGRAAAHYAETPPRGEFVLVVEGAPPAEEISISLEDAVELALALQRDGLSASDAARQAAAKTGFAKSGLYRAMQNHPPK